MKILSSFFFFFLFCFAAPAWAALGDQATSISADSAKLSAKQINADVFKNYSVQELSSDANTMREYVNSDGVIFAITWWGSDHPDLSVVLGKYYSAYQKTEAETPKRRGQRTRGIHRENLVVQTWGQLRTLKGRAYDPSLVPAGVSISEIK